jgi:DNA-binding NarL/FixJ family response regulator
MRALVISSVCFYSEGISRALREDGFDVATATSTSDGTGPDARDYDVALVDLVSDTLEETLSSLVDRVPVVGLALTADPPVASAAALGVRVFVGSDQSLATLVQATRSAIAGDAVCPPSVAAALFGSLGREQEPRTAVPVEALTTREREIARLLVRGLSNKEIARELTIEATTVKNHVHQVLRKLDVRRRGQAADMLRDMWTERSSRSIPTA